MRITPHFFSGAVAGAVDAILGPLPDELAAVLVHPTLPTTSTSIEVTTLAEFNTQAAIANNHITVNGNLVGTGIIQANDVEVVGLPGSSIDALTIVRDIHRVRVADISLDSVAFNIPGFFDDELGQVVYDEALHATDITFDNVVVNNPTESAFVIYGKRISILDSTLTANWYCVYAGQILDIFNEDIIVHGTTMSSSGAEATMRILQTTRHTMTECDLTNGAKHNWRLHEGTTLAYAARNTLHDAGIMLTDPAEPGDTLGTVWFTDNDITYTLANGVVITLDPYTRIDRAEINDNRFVMDPGDATAFEDFWTYGAAPGNWNLTGNTVEAP